MRRTLSLFLVAAASLCGQAITVNINGVPGQTIANLISTDQSTPATPSAGTTALYSKLGAMCSENPAGVESCGFGVITGSSNTNIGYEGQYNLTTGGYNTNSGYQGQYNLTTGSYNTSSGFQAGEYIADGSTANQTSSNSLYDGYETYAKADGDTNENVIGNAAIGAGSNTTVLGNASITDTWLGGSGGASNVHAKDFVPASSTPSISGCSLASIVGNDHYGVITAGGVSCNAVLTFSYSALNGWSCAANNRTHPGATNLVGEASSTTTTATFAGTTVTGDKINYVCGPY